jgi:hypothetical protein
MTALYQMVPWKPGTIAQEPIEQEDGSSRPKFPWEKFDFWKSGVDPDRLNKFYRWGESLDTEFFNDRTSIILGDKPTPGAVEFQNKVLVATASVQGDGTVPDLCALLPGVNDLARARGADHMTLPLHPLVMQTIWRMISANVSVQRFRGDARPPVAKTPAAAGLKPKPEIPDLPKEDSLLTLAGVRPPAAKKVQPTVTPAGKKPVSPTGGGQRARAEYAAAPPAPPARRLRVFSFDPLLATDPNALGTESIVLRLDWDDESADGAKLQPGPVGEYLEVVDYDPASRCFYPPVDLNHPNLLAQDGMPLRETDPRFHQQMVYGVAMATIAVFERALGRSVLWSPYLPRDKNNKVIRDGNGRAEGEFVRRLRIYPHAMRDANAYYDPIRKALLFGYFPAQCKPGDKVLPRGLIFTCLSYDVVAHETTHALLDGMHRYLLDASNRDVLAFHEAFADIVALFQHFSHPEVLRHEIARTAGNVQGESMLGRLAQQFGEAMGMHKSLRNYLGEEDEKGVWRPVQPDPTQYATVREPHDRGAILVAAMFTAFVTIYRRRTKDLVRIATEGTGVLRPGDIHPDLVGRLADEASKVARHLLIMAVRALDYVPPVDLTFGEYLRALITGDVDLIPGDTQLYRVAVVDAFRQWGIYPADVRNLSVDSLVWSPPENASLKLDMGVFRELLGIGNGTLKIDRADIYRQQRDVRATLHEWMRDQFLENPYLAAEWGLNVSPDDPKSPDDSKSPDDFKPPKAPKTIAREKKRTDSSVVLPKFEVHSVRRCRRVGPDEQERIDILVEVVQHRDGYLSEDDQKLADKGELKDGQPDFIFRGGATLIIDPRGGSIRYAIRKSVTSPTRLDEVRKFYGDHGGSLGLAGNYFPKGGNPFPQLHATED